MKMYLIAVLTLMSAVASTDIQDIRRSTIDKKVLNTFHIMEWNNIVPGLKKAIVPAMNNNDWSAVREFLEGMTPANTAEHTQLQQIPVHSNIIEESCSRGFTELVSIFLNSGFPANYIVNKLINTRMLHLAASNGHLSLVKLLLNGGADIDCKTCNGRTPLYCALEEDHLVVVKYLISAGADVNMRYGKYGYTLLCEALWSDNEIEEMFQLLLDSGCDPNIQCDSFSPLFLAVSRNNVKIIQMLLDAGAHVNGTATGIPLHEAIHYCYIPIMKLLLQYGADVNAKDIHGNTALHQAVFSKILPLVKIMIRLGSQINTVNNNHETPLLISIVFRKYDIAMLLMNSGADLDLDIYHTLLLEAVLDAAPVEFIECLVEHGASVTTVKYHRTALQYVTKHSRYSNDTKLAIAKLLLIYGSDHYVEDDYGNTLLHWACEMGDVGLVEYLIYYGLNVDAKNREGKKPYDIATENGYNNIVKTIIHYLCNKYTSFN